jgi:hypothetical protein
VSLGAVFENSTSHNSYIDHRVDTWESLSFTYDIMSEVCELIDKPLVFPFFLRGSNWVEALIDEA